VKPVGTPPAGFPFTPGILAGDMLYISGKGDQLPGGGHPATFEEQARQCMRNVQSTLKEAKLDFRNAVMIHLFLDNPDNAVAAAKVYREFFKPGTEPALSQVDVDWLPGGTHVEVSCWATSSMKERKAVQIDDVLSIYGRHMFPAADAVWAGNTLYLSGVVGFEPKAEILPHTLEEQVRRMAENDRLILAAAGLGFEDIVSGHVYLKTIDDYAPMNNIYKEYYSAGPGVRTCLMPRSGMEKNAVSVYASFIAAKTKKE
jgi:2-iminobutanoate/2-iminopropanoate deaminase